jgi:hypothetical protein
MKLLAWNYWGLGNAPAVHGLLRCRKVEEVDVLFLLETKLDEKMMTMFKKKLGMANMEVVDCEGKGRGLAAFWWGGIDVVLRSKSENHIDLEVQETGGDKCHDTGIYGEPQADLKYKTWERLVWLRDQDDEQLPWVCREDFNEILFHHEKEGGVPRSQACLDRFKNVLEACELDDLGFFGDIFTWRNKQITGSTHIIERLDLAVANLGWRVKFLLMQVKNGDSYHSNHRPVGLLTKMLP